MRLEYRTSSVPPKERFEYWHEVVCKRFVSADSVHEETRLFDAALTTGSLGRLEISEMDAPSHSWSRRLKHIRSDGEEHYLLSIIDDGSGVLEQNGRTAKQAAGDISLYDTARPFEYALSGRLKLIKIPHRYLDARVPGARDILARNLASDRRLSSLLVNAVDTAYSMELRDDAHHAVEERVADSIIDLLLVLIDLCREGESIYGYGAGSLEKIKAFALANLGDHSLSIQRLAEEGGVSRRTLNRLFAGMGTTPMRWVLGERLRLSKSYLEEGYAKSVTEAAFMVGFNDLSHFSRSFKQRFGQSPEQVLRRQ